MYLLKLLPINSDTKRRREIIQASSFAFTPPKPNTDAILSTIKKEVNDPKIEMQYTIQNCQQISFEYHGLRLQYDFHNSYLAVQFNDGENLNRLFMPQFINHLFKQLSLMKNFKFRHIHVVLDQPDKATAPPLDIPFWDVKWRQLPFSKELSPAGQMYDQMEREVLSYLSHYNTAKDARICVPACGRGELIEKLFEQSPEYSVHGFDLSRTVIQEIKSRENPNLSTDIKRVDDANYWSTLGQFKVIIAGGILTVPVLEQSVAARAFDLMVTALEPGGYLIIYGQGEQHILAKHAEEKGLKVHQEYLLSQQKPFLFLEKPPHK